MNTTINLNEVKWDELDSLELNKKGKSKIRLFLLNQPPPSKWIKTHSIYGNKYLPIDKIEYLLTIFFGQWRVEVKEIDQYLNSMTVAVRVHYMNPESEEFIYQDGVGASPLQVKSGANPTDLQSIQHNAVMLALPIAKTNAIKDATHHIGVLFGRDLNRKDTIDYVRLVADFQKAKIIER